MQIHLDTTHSVGMGDYLCFISLLCDIPDTVVVHCNNSHSTFDRLSYFKRVLNITDEQFKLVPADHSGDFSITGWPVKLFSKYYKPSSVNIRGQDLEIDYKNTRDKKGYIGLVCYTTNQMYIDQHNNYIEWDNNQELNLGQENIFPQTRLRPVDYYARIFEFIKTRRYDVITIDSMHTNFEDKVEMMVKHCKAIIGYEGGVAHLAHMLDIPYFMLDWQLPCPSTVFGDMHCEIVHQSKSMYVLRNDQELFNWSAEEFDQKIYDVWNIGGNNRFTNGTYSLDFPNGILSQMNVDDQTNNTLLSLRSMFGKNSLGKILKKYYFDTL
jgi:hypothetical protein